MITNPKVGDKYWIIFVQHDGSGNREFLGIARATVTLVEAAWPNDFGLGPYCLCAVVQEDNHVFFAPQRVHTYNMYNTWEEAVTALTDNINKGIQQLRKYKETLVEEVKKGLPADTDPKEIETAVESHFATQCSLIGIQEFPEGQTGRAG